MSSREWSRIEATERRIVESYLVDVPIKLGAVARELGISVKLSTLNPGESGMISREGGAYVIKINRYESRERQRFTLAHEIAHFLLHRDIIDASENGIVDNVLYRSGASEQVEYEANRLAADLVMPKNLITPRLHQIGMPISEEVIEYLANTFQVSKAAMEIRLTPMAA
ncbi:MAG: ImmA/IrrE family metallo-endopeptidase [Rhizobiaceae bacterium]|nr:ImmA/IrrE family metallo-endopeptidase [Rhizobiaceae bacterium]